jgi:hypothetical protein
MHADQLHAREYARQRLTVRRYPAGMGTCYAIHKDFTAADYEARKAEIDAELIAALTNKPPQPGERFAGEPSIRTFTLAPQSRIAPELELRVEAEVLAVDS